MDDHRIDSKQFRFNTVITTYIIIIWRHIGLLHTILRSLSTNSLVCLVLLKRLFCFVNIIGLTPIKPEGYRLEDRVQLHFFVLTKHYFRKPVKTDFTLLILLFLCILPRSSSLVVRENNNRYHSLWAKGQLVKT